MSSSSLCQYRARPYLQSSAISGCPLYLSHNAARKTRPKTIVCPGSQSTIMSYPSEPPALVSRYSLLNVTLKRALITVANRYSDGETARLEGRVCPSPILPITMASRSPVSSPSWDISSESSAESGFVPDAPTTAEPIPEQIGFGGMYYDHVQNGHYQHRWEFSGSGHGHSAPPRILAHPAGIPVGPSPSHVVGARGEFTRPFPRPGNDEISYTDEANTKLSNRIRRRCFNCKATETSTWRRSVLSPGKLVGHRCDVPEPK